jgi:hypothetical protein
MTPDMRAEIGEGLAGWAYGSHLWKGMIPALMEKPRKKQANATRMSGEVMPCTGEKANEPVAVCREMIPRRTKRVENWVMMK